MGHHAAPEDFEHPGGGQGGLEVHRDAGRGSAGGVVARLGWGWRRVRSCPGPAGPPAAPPSAYCPPSAAAAGLGRLPATCACCGPCSASGYWPRRPWRPAYAPAGSWPPACTSTGSTMPAGPTASEGTSAATAVMTAAPCPTTIPSATATSSATAPSPTAALTSGSTAWASRPPSPKPQVRQPPAQPGGGPWVPGASPGLPDVLCDATGVPRGIGCSWTWHPTALPLLQRCSGPLGAVETHAKWLGWGQPPRNGAESLPWPHSPSPAPPRGEGCGGQRGSPSSAYLWGRARVGGAPSQLLRSCLGQADAAPDLTHRAAGAGRADGGERGARAAPAAQHKAL